MAQRRAAGVQQPWLRRQVTAQITQPADACAAKVPLQRPAPVLGALTAAGQRQAGIKPRLHRQQHRQIRNVARHGARHAELLEEHLVGGPMRHAAHGGAQAIHVVERRGGAQRPHHVRAVGHRQHAQSHGHPCATAAAASRALWVKRVARGAVHGVEGVAARPAGELLATHALRNALEADRVVADIEALQGLRRGLIRVCCSAGFAIEFLPKAMAQFREQHPGMQFHLRVAAPAAVTQAVLNTEADIGLTYSRTAERDIELQTLAGRTLPEGVRAFIAHLRQQLPPT